jgi:hypothetical protein
LDPFYGEERDVVDLAMIDSDGRMLIIFWTANRDAPIPGDGFATNNWIGLRDRYGDQGLRSLHMMQKSFFSLGMTELVPLQREKNISSAIHNGFTNNLWRRVNTDFCFLSLRTSISSEKERPATHLCLRSAMPE